MQFIKISNPAESVNRLYLEKLGLSTKRDDPNTIGQFGSGTKFAPISALRKDIRWISVGEDEQGKYQLEFVNKEENGINNIYCLYNDSELKATSFTLEAGMLSWEDDFQIFREAFANAMDAKISEGVEFSIDVVDQIKNEDGIFSVYLTATPEMIDIVENFDRYFSFNREPIFADGSYKIYQSIPGSVNIYTKGVRVYEGSEFGPSIFDYEFPVTLNEERRPRSEWSLWNSVGHCLSRLKSYNDDEVEIAKIFFDQHSLSKFETTNIPLDSFSEYAFNESSAFNKIFYDEYGENACLVHKDDAKNKNRVKAHNFVPVIVKNEMMYQIFSMCKVRKYEDVVGDSLDFKFFDLDEDQQEMFEKAHNIINETIPVMLRDVRNWKFYIPVGEQDTILGVAKGDDVYLSAMNFQDIEMLLGTMVHEIHHVFYAWGEHDADFRGYADELIGKLLRKMMAHNDQ